MSYFFKSLLRPLLCIPVARSSSHCFAAPQNVIHDRRHTQCPHAGCHSNTCHAPLRVSIVCKIMINVHAHDSMCFQRAVSWGIVQCAMCVFLFHSLWCLDNGIRVAEFFDACLRFLFVVGLSDEYLFVCHTLLSVSVYRAFVRLSACLCLSL